MRAKKTKEKRVKEEENIKKNIGNTIKDENKLKIYESHERNSKQIRTQTKKQKRAKGREEKDKRKRRNKI